jgi:hypothetical protein
MVVGGRGLVIESLTDLHRLSKAVVASGLAPRSFKTTEQVLVAMLSGMEIGLGPMTSLRAIAVINGTPQLWGDAALALARRSPRFIAIDEWYEFGGKQLPRPIADGIKDDYTAVCSILVRRGGGGESTIERSFSWGEARRAGLTDKDTYKQYPSRMLLRRARSFALRDALPEQFSGLDVADEFTGETPVSVEAEMLNTKIAERERVSAAALEATNADDQA